MRAVRIAGADDVPIGAPHDWDPNLHGHCGGLFVRREIHTGVAYMRSAWDVEPVEAQLLLAGAPVTLGVQGHVHPVVQLGIGDLPADFEPVMTARRYVAPDGQAMVRVEMLYPHAGGKRGFCQVPVETTLARAVERGIVRIEEQAKQLGWVE